MRRTAMALITATLLTATTLTGFAGPVAAAAPTADAGAALTNLAHLDFLSDRVAVANSAAHSTYRLADDRKIGVVWVYADAKAGGTFQRVGGGGLDAATGKWGQGSYDTDDITRAAVVYLRQWEATGDPHAKEQAYQMLRGRRLLPDVDRPEGRRGRAVDATGRHTQPHADLARLA